MWPHPSNLIFGIQSSISFHIMLKKRKDKITWDGPFSTEQTGMRSNNLFYVTSPKQALNHILPSNYSIDTRHDTTQT